MNRRNSNTTPARENRKPFPKMPWVWDVLIIGVLLIGAYFRFIGIDWDQNYHLHPDERFLTMVESSLQSVDSLDQYFDTSMSTLNPNNRGYSYYVYGTFPLFLVRYLGEWLNQTGYGEIYIVGRYASGVFDLGTILLIYLIAKRLFKNPRLGLMASLFYSLSVLSIQLSHFFTVDTTATFFATLAVYLAVCIFMPGQRTLETERKAADGWYWLKEGWGSLVLYVSFAIAYGLALASKVSIYPLALLLPLAGYIFFNKLNEDQKDNEWPIILRNLVLAAITAFLTFRIFQPYAFVGPDFFNFKINPQWISGLKELAAQSNGSVDVPYALQWVRRPVTFAFQNLVEWGLGVPLGLLALAGFLWMTWRIVKGDWQKYIVLWFWVAVVFVIEALTWNCMMRYMIQIYPILAIMAALTIFKLWEDGKVVVSKIRLMQVNWKRVLAVFCAVVVIAGTVAWAYAFSRIYTRPVTRVAASEWVYQNIPGAINLKISAGDSEVNQPVPYRNGATISATDTLDYVFTPSTDEELIQINFEHISLQQAESEILSLVATISLADDPYQTVIASGYVQSNFPSTEGDRGDSISLPISTPIALDPGQKYRLTFQIAEADGIVRVLGDIDLEYSKDDKVTRQYLAAPSFRLTPETTFQNSFVPVEDGILDSITLYRAVDVLENPQAKTLTVNVVDMQDQNKVLATGTLTDTFTAGDDPRGETKEILLDQPVTLDHTHGYLLIFSVRALNDGSETALSFYNNTLATESSWDDAIPLSMHNYDAWGNENGIYGNNKNFEMYWEDNETKLERFESILNQADTLVITSNRQWGTITRVDERYSLSTEYYRALVGCPADKDILWCYQVAEPGMFSGELGYELTAVFTSNPNIGSFEINDQSSEEAFTVYDHPKVLIFQKTADYSAEKVDEILGAVDLTKAVHPSLQESDGFTGNLYLSDEAVEVQQSGGTWSQIFDFAEKVSSNQWVMGIVWYVAIALLGWIVYPFVRWALKALPDHGYPMSRLAGLLLLTLFTWLAGSSGAYFTRTTILIVAAVLLIANLILAVIQRRELAEEFRKKKRYFLTVELLFLVFFLIDLGIRLGNPDLWHPWKGGEKPMDLSYFTAIIKSTTFPPYDPWFSGGYINYYYYGFVIAAVPVKLLGIIPSIAYNLILPTLFAMTAMGAFSVVWNLLRGQSDSHELDERIANRRALFGGLISSFFVLIIGNLGTLRMLWQGVQKLAAPDGNISNAGFFQHFGWFFSGLIRFLQGAQLPFGTGEWYWVPSRAITGDVITEFPFFTFTYADLHAHMIALPITILALSFTLAILLGKWRWGASWKERIASYLMTFGLGGVVIGALRPTNTWDLPVYLCLAAIAIVYVIIRYAELPHRFLPKSPNWLRRCLFAILNVAFLAALVFLFYLPFSKWYGQSYGSIDKWTGDHSALTDYLVHWGFFFFIIVSWFVWETHEWLASTPVSALKSLKPYLTFIQILVILAILVLVLLVILGVEIGWVAFPLAVWTLVLLLRPKQHDVKKLILFMIGTALVLTIFVELFNLHGDVGRMNTVFKFYYQAWTLLAVSAAASLMWLIPAVMTKWKESTSMVWQIFLAILVFGVMLYPITAAQDKISDRMSSTETHSLDGMDYMKTSVYGDQDTTFELSQDYAAIKWMQENVQGSPVIVEGNTVEYRWGNRYTIYTGLPGVLGWNWHQRQQRGYLEDNEVYNRIEEIANFYLTTDIDKATAFINEYNVSYIILGQLEKAYYPGDGLAKFDAYEGVYWQEVYRFEDTVIYQVIAQE